MTLVISEQSLRAKPGLLDDAYGRLVLAFPATADSKIADRSYLLVNPRSQGLPQMAPADDSCPQLKVKTNNDDEQYVSHAGMVR